MTDNLFDQGWYEKKAEEYTARVRQQKEEERKARKLGEQGNEKSISAPAIPELPKGEPTTRESALDLNKLLEGNDSLRGNGLWAYRAQEKFISLFKKKWFIFSRYCELTKEQIKDILKKNNLVRPGADANHAVDETVRGRYQSDLGGPSYWFIRLENNRGEELFRMRDNSGTYLDGTCG